MINRHSRGSVAWIDLESPTEEELGEVMREFNIDTRIEQEVSKNTPYPIVVSSPNYLYLILHFPTCEIGGGAKDQEIDFIVGKQFLITVRYEVIRSLQNLHKVVEAEELLDMPISHEHSAAFLERVLRHLYAALKEEVNAFGSQLDHIEKDIFGGKERKTVHVISQVNRVLLRFDMTIGRHAESLSSLLSELSLPQFFGKKFLEYAARIDAEREHVATLVSSYREMAAELRDTNDSLLSASQNEVMKTLTVVTAIILPLTLVTSIFQMNVENVPFAHDPNAFWIVVGGILILTGLQVLYAKHKKWL